MTMFSSSWVEKRRQELQQKRNREISARAFNEESPMTTPTDDPKVKELLEAAKALEMSFSEEGSRTAENNWHVTSFEYRERLNNAVAAFDPPKPKQYTMPTWEEFVRGKEAIWLIGPDDKTPCGVRLRKNGLATVWRDDYDALRELSATAREEG